MGFFNIRIACMSVCLQIATGHSVFKGLVFHDLELCRHVL